MSTFFKTLRPPRGVLNGNGHSRPRARRGNGENS